MPLHSTIQVVEVFTFHSLQSLRSNGECLLHHELLMLISGCTQTVNCCGTLQVVNKMIQKLKLTYVRTMVKMRTK